MMHSLRRLLYESTPAEFRSAYSVAESVERLRAATKRSTFAAIGEAAAVGKVSQDGVRLQRVTPMVHNSFKPFFVGRFESRDGATLLTGRFGMSMECRWCSKASRSFCRFRCDGGAHGIHGAKTGPTRSCTAVGALEYRLRGFGIGARRGCLGPPPVGVVGRVPTARHFDHHFAAGDA